MVQYYLGCLHHCLTLPIPSPGIFDHKFLYYCCANVLFPINLLSYTLFKFIFSYHLKLYCVHTGSGHALQRHVFIYYSYLWCCMHVNLLTKCIKIIYKTKRGNNLQSPVEL